MKQNGVFWQVGLLVSMLSACDYIQDDLQPCPTGLELAFRYDYNLQRADQFNDHVRSVTAYLFDEEGYFVAAQTESGTPLSERTYRMKLDVDPGRYQCVVVAGQKPVKEMAAGPRAKQIVHEPEVGDSLSALSVTLERDAQGLVTHHGLPLDTLWHGMRLTPIEVKAGQITVDTLSLMRNTKQINVILRDLDEPENMEVANYDFRIDDHNACLNWDNSVTYQTSSNENVLALPKLAVYSNLYLLFKVAGVLHVQFGVDCNYYTKYYAPAYNPATSSFHNQHEVKCGNFAFMNAYANMKLKKTRFFVMFSHFNQGMFGGDNYFSSPHYPLNPRRLQMGLSVDFTN